MKRRISYVDVFTTEPYLGNPVAVGAGRVHIDRDADGTIWTGGGTVTCVTGTVAL